VKVAFLGGTSYSLVLTLCCGMYRLATMHSVTDRQTDGRTDDSITPIVDHTVRSTIAEYGHIEHCAELHVSVTLFCLCSLYVQIHRGCITTPERGLAPLDVRAGGAAIAYL